MKQTRIMMGMPITIEVVDIGVSEKDIERGFDYFEYIDKKFSTYKKTSEITKFNKGMITEKDFSSDMQEVFKLSEETKTLTDGYFDIYFEGRYDPSGIVKGWAINNLAKMYTDNGFENFYIEAGGDIQAHGYNAEGKKWSVGIRNPFNLNQIVKVIYIENKGIATSGIYIRGQHIYDPRRRNSEIKDVVSLTIIGPNIYEADRFATAAFAMGKKGIEFIESVEGLEGYMIDNQRIATFTSGFKKYAMEDVYEINR